MNNEGVSGSYRSSEGIKDDAVWSTRGKWMDLNGIIGNEKFRSSYAIILKTKAIQHTGMPVGMDFLPPIRLDGAFHKRKEDIELFNSCREVICFQIPFYYSFRYRLYRQRDQ